MQNEKEPLVSLTKIIGELLLFLSEDLPHNSSCSHGTFVVLHYILLSRSSRVFFCVSNFIL